MTQCDSLFSKILVPVDGSRFSMKAVALANRLAVIHHAEVRLVHVVDSVVMHQLCKFSREPYAAVRANMEQSGSAFLDDMAGRLRKGGKVSGQTKRRKKRSWRKRPACTSSPRSRLVATTSLKLACTDCVAPTGS